MIHNWRELSFFLEGRLRVVPQGRAVRRGWLCSLLSTGANGRLHSASDRVCFVYLAYYDLTILERVSVKPLSMSSVLHAYLDSQQTDNTYKALQSRGKYLESVTINKMYEHTQRHRLKFFFFYNESCEPKNKLTV